MATIVLNKIKCKFCGDEIESEYTHDFKWCKCGRVYIDGGHEYLKRGFQTPIDYIDLSVVESSDGGEESV